LELAPYATASQLERVAAGRRRVDADQARETHKARHLSTYYDDDGAPGRHVASTPTRAPPCWLPSLWGKMF